jgi:hypothetical protein
MAYVVPIVERDPEKQNRSIRNAHERLTDVEADVADHETRITTLEAVTHREVLSADRTYYVRTDGSNSNNGLANTAGGAFLTINKAIDTVAGLDLTIYNVTIQVGNGTYTTPVVLKRCIGAGTVTIQGDSATPSNVVVSTTSADGISGAGVAKNWIIKDLKVATATTGSGIFASGLSDISITNIVFGACATNHVRASDGALITATGAYEIAGNAIRHALTSYHGIINMSGRTITLTGTPAFTLFVDAQTLGAQNWGSVTFSGTATGTRYSVTLNGVVNTGGGGANYLPGNAAGSTATGGQYA